MKLCSVTGYGCKRGHVFVFCLAIIWGHLKTSLGDFVRPSVNWRQRTRQRTGVVLRLLTLWSSTVTHHLRSRRGVADVHCQLREMCTVLKFMWRRCRSITYARAEPVPISYVPHHVRDALLDRIEACFVLIQPMHASICLPMLCPRSG